MRRRKIVGIAVGIGMLIGLSVGFWIAERKKIPRRTVIELDLEEGLREAAPTDPFGGWLARRAVTIRDVVDALARAASDDRVAGLLVRGGTGTIGFAHVQELRAAVEALRAKGKFAVFFAETFGEFAGATSAYYLATAFDEIRLQPSGDLGLTGIHAEVPFVRGTLDKIGVRIRGDKRYEYKNALDMVTEKGFTPAHRKATESVVRSLFDQVVRAVAASRKLGEAEVRALIDRAPLTAQEALAAKLVDALSYRDETYEAAKRRAGEGAELLYLRHYLERAGRPHRGGKTIALVYAVGGINRGRSDPQPFGSSAGSDTVAAALRAAVRDPDVKAIVLRVNSPGGSYTASDTIWRETIRAREARKPVVASMSNVAASGGYFISMAADKIVAEPGTITGSIGVFAAKPVAGELFAKLGISFGRVQAGANAAMFSSTTDYSPSEWARVQSFLDRVYDDFTRKVARGRRLALDRVLAIARGRVWTGEQAKAHGLIDAEGGLAVALRLAAEAAGIAPDDVRVQIFPKPKEPPFERLTRMFREDEPESSEQDEGAPSFLRALGWVEGLASELRSLAATLDERVLLSALAFHLAGGGR